MSTLEHVSSEGLEETHLTKADCRKYRPCFWLVSTLLEMSAAKQAQKNKHMFKSWACFDYNKLVWRYCQGRSFQSCNSVDTHSITLSRYWFSPTQCHHIPIREIENGITRGPEVHHLVSILHAVASLKAVLPFDFVNTSDQKPSTLCAQPYWVLDTLPNHYYMTKKP